MTQLYSELIVAILGSGVISAFVTQLFLKWKSDKQISIENVTQERKEWRVRIRELLLDLTTAFETKDIKLARRVEAELIVRLNPEDQDDLAIINMFPALYDDWKYDSLQEFSDRLAYLLKHDWERVKYEVNGRLTIYKLFLLLVAASISVYLFFYIVCDLIMAEVSSLSQMTLYFCIWLLISLGVICLVDFLVTKCVSKKSTASIVGIFKRYEYKIRSKRKNNSK